MINTINVVFKLLLICGAISGIVIIIDNWKKIFQYLIKKKSSGSLIPILGPLLVFISMYFWPEHKPLWMYIIPFLIDYASVPMLIHTLLYVLMQRNKIK